MSKQNLEVVSGLIDAFRTGMEHGDYGSWFDSGALAEDVEVFPAQELPGPRRYTGREGFVEFMRSWTEDFADWSVHADRLVDAPGDQVVVLATQSATGRGSGLPVEMHFGVVCTLDEGKVIRMRFYLDSAEALRTAGMSG